MTESVLGQSRTPSTSMPHEEDAGVCLLELDAEMAPSRGFASIGGDDEARSDLVFAAAVYVADLGTVARRHLDLLDAAEGVRACPHGGVEEGLAGHGVSDA